MALSVDEVLEVAYTKFEEKKYDEALEMFVSIYNAGYDKDTILQNLYNCYVLGNEDTFRKTFEYQCKKNQCIYEECCLEFFPYKDGEYYIYNCRKKFFEGVFSANALENVKQEQVLDVLEFTPITLAFNGMWEKFFSILTSAKERKIYTICSNRERMISYFKIPEIKKYMDNVMIFQNLEEYQKYFHEHTAEYLPRIVFASENEAEKINAILDKEHQYRLTEEGRNKDNILLTIGIPTHDRGNLLLKRLDNLLQMPYDAEIEITISKNGTHYYQKEYESIEKIKDSRIQYVGYNREITMSENWGNVIYISHGKYVLMVSDEDDVILSALEHYLKILKENKNVAFVRAKTKVQYSLLSETKVCQQGLEAFEESFLRGNYLSGTIYNKQKFVKIEIEDWNRKYKDNIFYRTYPHLWWNMLLCYQGNYIVDTVTLIHERDSVGIEESKKYKKDNVTEGGLADEYMDLKNNIPIPSTYESRMKQFWGGIELINNYFQNDNYMKIKAWTYLTTKTMYLMKLVGEEFHYKSEELPLWLGKLLEDAIVSLDHIGIDKAIQKELAENVLNSIKK